MDPDKLQALLPLVMEHAGKLAVLTVTVALAAGGLIAALYEKLIAKGLKNESERLRNEKIDRGGRYNRVEKERDALTRERSDLQSLREREKEAAERERYELQQKFARLRESTMRRRPRTRNWLSATKWPCRTPSCGRSR